MSAALAVVCAAALVDVPPASASVSRLCSGYAACAQAGMTAAGYASVNETMYWRMYAGHNCTNYAAYRMIRSGLPNERPWSGSGNATNWGDAMSSITDGAPRVGSVAWWRAGVYPAGSAGHVAYVEEVVSDDEIVVSQDSWGGDFSWARITRDSRGWPSGFIHFNDVPLVNTAAPTVAGQARVGSVLQARPGSWTPYDVTLRYQWRAGGEAIEGATLATFTVPRSLLGKRVTVRVTASKTGYSDSSVTADRTEVVEPGVLSTATAPQVDGDARVDGVLTTSPGEWQPTPDAVSYQWLADGTPVRGAEGSTLSLGADLVGRSLSVRVTAHKRGYDDVAATSARTAAVAPGTLTVAATPVLTGRPRLGERLTLDTGTLAPSADPSVRWYRAGVRVRGESGSTYSLTTADLGQRIRARVRWTRPGYTTLTTRTSRTGRVRTVPEMSVGVRARSGILRFLTNVIAAGVDPVPGVVRVRTSGRTVAETPLSGGRAVATVEGLRPGTRTFRIVVPASATVARGAVVREVTVR